MKETIKFPCIKCDVEFRPSLEIGEYIKTPCNCNVEYILVETAEIFKYNVMWRTNYSKIKEL